MKKLTILMLSLMIVLSAGSAFARCIIAATIDELECVNGCFTLDWSVVENCGGATIEVQRRASGTTAWATIATDITDGFYTDCPGSLAPLDYKIILHCNAPCDQNKEYAVWLNVTCD
ncbi:MAG: hypothetical protein GY835_01910 [bacterium]|nr:hypothetical protein [bacterium]